MNSKSAKETGAAKSDRGTRAIAAGVALLALVGVAIAIVVGGGGDKPSSGSSGGAVSGVSDVRALLAGIPQRRDELGKSDAPVTLYEFVDYQCPFCRQFSVGPLRTLIKDYVRPGKVKIVLRPLAFIGPDSGRAARAGAAAGRQNKLWTFTELWYFNQGQENSGYATDAFVGKIYTAAGVDATAANAYRKGEASKQPLAEADSDAQHYAVDSTPSFVAGVTGGPYAKVDADAASPDKLRTAIDGLLP